MFGVLAGGGIDRVCTVLGDRYRREVLRCLENEADRSTTDELAREIARATGQPESTERILTILHHVHLPKLADENAIRYDADDRTVLPTGQTEQFIEYLDTLDSHPV